MNSYIPTPGTWRVQTKKVTDGILAGRDHIKVVGPHRSIDSGMMADLGIEDSSGHTIRDARLIAAAPDLLAAAKELLHEVMSDTDNVRLTFTLQGLTSKLHAAIRKAEGC